MIWRRLAVKAVIICGLLAVGLMLLTQQRAAARKQVFEAAFPPIGTFVTVAGQRVHYLQKGSGPHVVLIHGAGGNLRDFSYDLIDRLAVDFTVTAFDRPGLGYSDRLTDVADGPFATAGESPQAQAAALREAAAQLGVTAPVVVGHSYGGSVAMAWALAGLADTVVQDASAVVSLGGVLMPWPGRLNRFYRTHGSVLGGIVTIPMIAAFAPETKVDRSVAGVFTPDPVPDGYIAHIGAPLAIRQATFAANVRQVNTLRPHVVAMAEDYPQLTLPIEIIHGTADATVPIAVHPEELVKIVPTAHLTPLQNVGHMPHHADPQAAVTAIKRAATRAGLL